MLEAAIFDMDGVIIDSEPMWREVEIELFGAIGIPLTDEMCKETMGLRVDEVVAFWFERHPGHTGQAAALVEDIVAGVVRLIEERGEMLPGVPEAIAIFEERGLKLGLATSSFYEIIEAVLTRFDLKGRFEIVHSAQDEEFGKPHPAIYLSTAAKLGVEPERCVAIEDSPNGVLSAKRAGMKAIAVPDPIEHADVVLRSLEELSAEVLGSLD